MTNKSTSIITRSGRYFDYLDPDNFEYTIEDIAFALSNVCRFGGHVDFYSVAQHSFLVSYLVPKHLALIGLMHDAAEAFVGDCPTPLKALLPEYKVMEARISRAIDNYFGLMPCHIFPDTKQADLKIFAAECRDLFPDYDINWPILQDLIPAPDTVVPVYPAVARFMFLQRYQELTS